jgi:magnesium-transporting ATPase (P-type)
MRTCSLKTITLKLEQATLTGEINPVNKSLEAIKKTSAVGVSDKTNILFSSTLVVNGSAIGVVVTTGILTI